MVLSRSAMAARSGSGPLGAVAQMDWLGQPAHAAALPASSLEAPGQPEQRQDQFAHDAFSWNAQRVAGASRTLVGISRHIWLGASFHGSR